MSSSDLAYAVAILFVAYFVRGISGFGSGLLAVPLLALRFPLLQVVPFMLIADFGASALIGGLHLRLVDRAEIKRLLPATLIGVALGTSLLVSLPPAVLLIVLAVFILAFALRSLLTGNGPFSSVSPLWAWPAALAGGAVSGLFGTGGPPYVIYLSHRLRDKSRLRATLSGLFFLEGLIRIVSFVVAGLLFDADVWIHTLLALPIVVAALHIGGHVHTRLNDAQMRRAVSLLLVISAVSLLVKACR